MLETPSIRRYLPSGGNNASGADNQQERPRLEWRENHKLLEQHGSQASQSTINRECNGRVMKNLGILRDHTPDSLNGTSEMRWSDLHGDMQRLAEMTGPPWQMLRLMPGE